MGVHASRGTGIPFLSVRFSVLASGVANHDNGCQKRPENDYAHTRTCTLLLRRHERGRKPVRTHPPTAPETITFERDYPGRADQVRHVRGDVAEHLGECPVTDDLMLIASEFATNAVLHSRSRGGHFTIRVKLHDDYLRLECQDAGGAWRGRQHTADRPHGLDIVEALTGPARWGTERTPDDTRVVWATLEWPGRSQT